MEWKELFYDIFKTFNPDAYNELVSKDLKHAYRYFSFILLISITIMFLLFIPLLLSFPSYLYSKTQDFESFAITKSFNTTKPVKIIDKPTIMFSSHPELNNSDAIIVTNDAIYFKEYYFFGKIKPRPLDTHIDLKDPDTIKKSVYPFMIFITPSLFFWSIIFFTIYFWFFIILTFLFFLTVKSVLRFSVHWKTLLKVCIYSSTVLIVLQLLSFPFYRLFFIPLIAYWILVMIVLFLLKDYKPMHHHKNIFEQHHEHKHDFDYTKRKHYDNEQTDEHRKVSHRKSSYEEENEGYIELK